MKKRQEMEILEEKVARLQEQKAAVESANEELKRQNKYWEDLFAKQQLQSVVPVSVSAATIQSNYTGTVSDLTRSDHSEQGNDSSQPTYTDLKIASDRGSKR